MANVALPYFSATGHTRRLAEQIAGGLGECECNARLIDVTELDDRDWEAMDAADVILMGSPTFMGGVAAQFKAFMDQSGDFWVDQKWKDKLAGGFTVATHPSGDKLSTLMQMTVFAAQHGMIWVGQDTIGTPINADAPGINASGSWLGLAAQNSQDYASPLSASELETARLFGHRIAHAAKRWAV